MQIRMLAKNQTKLNQFPFKIQYLHTKVNFEFVVKNLAREDISGFALEWPTVYDFAFHSVYHLEWNIIYNPASWSFTVYCITARFTIQNLTNIL